MKNSILEKIRALLSGPVETECQVVYLLCEVRKLLPENSKLHANNPQMFALRFHCNWALHINLSRSTTHQFLAKIDHYISNRLNPPERDEKEEMIWQRQAQEMILEFIDLPTFRAG